MLVAQGARHIQHAQLYYACRLCHADNGRLWPQKPSLSPAAPADEPRQSRASATKSMREVVLQQHKAIVAPEHPISEKKVGTPKAPRSNARRALAVTCSSTELLPMASPNSRASSLMRAAIAAQVWASIRSFATNTAWNMASQ